MKTFEYKCNAKGIPEQHKQHNPSNTEQHNH